jgi:serine/threonine protein kinase/Tfp pilus assembly protein PilF
MGVTCSNCGTDNTQDSEFCKKCGTQIIDSEEKPLPTQTIEAPREELTTGSTFAGRYQIIEELGKGGMGKVYKAHDTEIKEKIALKLIKPEISADKKTIERFQNELKFARKIGHRNVCRMYDLNKEEGSYYITMEYVSGEDLKSFIRRVGQLPSGKAISIAKQVADGLVEAHRLGVIHRDLKPSNIMIDKEGNARIMDFGIARSVEAKGITGAGVMIGTPEYMPPEQAEAKEVDQRSDIYSLGVILYEMVTGRVPFEGDTALSIAMKHKGEEPKDPREFNSHISEDLSRVILRCLEKEKEKRYQSAGEIRSELENIEKGIPTTERVIPEKKPLTSREITVQFNLKKLFIPALAFIAVVIIGVILWQVLQKKKAAPLIPSDKLSLGVVYFENNTGDDSLDHWRKALSELLIADLSQSKHIRVLSRDRLFNILKEMNLLEAKSYSSKDLEEVAARGRVENILQGAYAKAGENIRINVMLQQASTGELLGSESVEGMGEKSMFSMVDELTRRIKASFRLSEETIASDIDMEVEKITTSSPEAFRYYSEGREQLGKAENLKSIESMEKAIAIDPEFAMAYRAMAVSYGNLGYASARRNNLQKALELSERVSDRERYQIQGDFYSGSEKTFDKAIEAFNKLLVLYPDDTAGNNNLGALYSALEEWEKAIDRFEALKNLGDEHIFTYTNLAGVYMAKGLYDTAEEVLEEYIKRVSDAAFAHLMMARNCIHQKKFDLALSKVEKAASLDPNHPWSYLSRGNIYTYKGDLINAENEYQKLLEAEEQVAHFQGRRYLGALNLLQGKIRKSKDQIKKGIELAKQIDEKQLGAFFCLELGYRELISGNYKEALEEQEKAWIGFGELDDFIGQRYTLFSKGITYLEMKSTEEAQRTADELKEMIETGMNKKEMRYYHHLIGRLELGRENYSKAIECLKKAISFLPYENDPDYDDHALFMEPLALAYFQAGNLEQARVEFERIISLTSGRLGFGDIYAKSFYMLGKIYEQKDFKGKAIENYEKFLDLCKDADPGISEVDDARERMAGLKSQ